MQIISRYSLNILDVLWIIKTKFSYIKLEYILYGNSILVKRVFYGFTRSDLRDDEVGYFFFWIKILTDTNLKVLYFWSKSRRGGETCPFNNPPPERLCHLVLCHFSFNFSLLSHLQDRGLQFRVKDLIKKHSPIPKLVSVQMSFLADRDRQMRG